MWWVDACTKCNEQQGSHTKSEGVVCGGEGIECWEPHSCRISHEMEPLGSPSQHLRTIPVLPDRERETMQTPFDMTFHSVWSIGWCWNLCKQNSSRGDRGQRREPLQASQPLHAYLCQWLLPLALCVTYSQQSPELGALPGIAAAVMMVLYMATSNYDVIPFPYNNTCSTDVLSTTVPVSPICWRMQYNGYITIAFHPKFQLLWPARPTMLRILRHCLAQCLLCPLHRTTLESATLCWQICICTHIM